MRSVGRAAAGFAGLLLVSGLAFGARVLASTPDAEANEPRLDLALGGEYPIDGLASPAAMHVAHIRVYRDRNATP